METGLLNFHDEETFATSIYDQGDFSGVSGQMSILDMLHSDLQYSSDYLNQSAAHWDSDQEQEHNGDLAVLPVAPSECGSLNSSKEDYNKSLFEWQDSLMTYQPLDPDVIDLRLDGQVIPSELPDNIFEDSFESNSSVSSFIPKSSSPVPAGRSSTPNPCHKETNTSTDASLNLDVSLSALDVNVSDIDISALGINVSSLDIKTETAGIEENKLLTPPKSVEENHSTSVDENTEKWIQKSVLQPGKVTSGVSFKEDHELASLLGISEEYPSFQAEMSCNTPDISVLKRSQLSVSKLESTDVEQLHDIAMEFINEEQQAEAWVRNTLIGASLDCNVDFESSSEIPALKAGNLESLLEQFEATLQPVPEYSQSMPASPAPAYFSIPPSPLSMPASPSCLPSSPSSTSGLKKSKSPSLASPMQSPSKSIPGTPKKSPSTKLYQNILPSEVMDRIKASGRKKSIPLIPAMPSKKSVKSSTRMHAAGAALSRNKLLKVVSRKGTDGENIQFDHDYCSNDSLSNLEFVPDHLVKDIKASAKQMDCDDDKLSRKDSGLESGDFSEDSEGAIVTPANDSNVSSKVNRVSILKPRGSNFNGRNKEMLMVSVLKKVRSEATQSPSAGRTVACQHISTPSSESFRSKSLAAAQPASRTLLKPIDRLLSTPGNPSDEIKVSKGGNVTCERSVPTIPKTSKPNPVENLTKGSKEVIVCQGIAQSVISEASEPKGELKVMSVSSDRSDTKPCVDVVPVKSLEQPKKRKLNLEEYRSRLKAMEQKRENSVPQTVLTTDTPKVNAHPNLITEDKTNVENAIIPDKEVNLLNVTNTINMSIVKEEKNSDNIMGGTEMNESKVKVKSDLTCVKVDEETKPATDKKLIDQTKPGSVKKATEEAKPATEKRTKSVTSDGAKSSVDKKAKTVLSEEAKSSADKKTKPVIKEEVKPSTDKKAEFVVELEEKLKIDEGEKGAIDEDAQSAGEKKKLRQYRSRRLSTSSSDGSPSIKEVVKSSENSRKKSVWPQSKSRSRSASSSIRSRHDSNSSKSSRSRSSSSSNNSSSSSSSSRSSSSMKSTHKRRRMAKTKRHRRRKRTRSSCSRSSSGSSSSRRSNSISSGSSRHSSQRARSRSLRRSRRERSSSRNRGRGGWRRRRRDSSRCRRGTYRNRSRRGSSMSSCSRSSNRSRSRSRASYRRRIDKSRSPSGRRWCSYSSQSESRLSSKISSSSSRSRSFSSGRDRRWSRSRIRSRDKKRANVEKQGRAEKSQKMRWRSRSPMRRNVDWSRLEKEQDRQIQERRVVYVGRIPEDTTKSELRRRFEVFGPIVDISLHFREHADSYGFVTFAYQVDAYEAVERGNDDKTQPRYDLCFGGRRKFCRERYADLDGAACKGSVTNSVPHISRKHEANSFDNLLRELQAKLQARKSYDCSTCCGLK